MAIRKEQTSYAVSLALKNALAAKKYQYQRDGRSSIL